MTAFRRRLPRFVEQLDARIAPATLSLQITPTTILEHTGANAAVATLTRGDVVSLAAVTVNLSSSDTTEATVPATVIIPSNQTSVTFPIAAIDDLIADGNQMPTIQAQMPNVGLSGPISKDVGSSQSSITKAVAVMADGRMVTAGSYFTNNPANYYDIVVSRWNADGTPDATFAGGSVTFDLCGDNDQATAVVVQSDGKVIVAGFGYVNSTYDFIMARLTSTGVLDTTFDGDGKVITENGTAFYNEIWDMVVQSDGKILVGGNIDSKLAVARYTSVGALDTSFDTDGRAISTVTGRGHGMIRNSDGSVVLVGDTNDGNASSQISVVKFTSTGALDSTFKGAGQTYVNPTGNYDAAFELARQPIDGKLVIVGQTARVGSSPLIYDPVIVRLNADGSPDTTFDSDGIVVVDVGGSPYMHGAGVAWQIDNRICFTALGGGGTGRVGVGRLDNTGKLEDTNFSSSGGTLNPELILRTDGTMWVASSAGFNGVLERFRTNEIVTGTATITVNDNDTPPIATDDTYTAIEDQALSIGLPASGAGVTAITMKSDSGEWVGQGGTYNFTPATGTITAKRNFDNGVSITYSSAIDNFHWDFAAPNSATPTPGTYFNAERFAFHTPSRPGLEVYGNGHGSNKVTAEFTVTEALYDSMGNVVRFGAKFEQHTDGSPLALTGDVIFNALGTPLVGVLSNDKNPTGGYMQAAVVTAPQHGSVNLALDGSFVYTPAPNYSGPDSFTYKVTNGSVWSSPATANLKVLPAPDVKAFVVNDNSAQRSRVTQLQVRFDAIIDAAAATKAFQLTRVGDGAPVGQLSIVTTNDGGDSVVTLTFSGQNTDFGSVADGRWKLAISAADIVTTDGVALASNVTLDFHRLFGDADGDADVDTTDFAAFRAAFGGPNNVFDFDNDGDVDSSDYGQFRVRFGSTI